MVFKKKTKSIYQNPIPGTNPGVFNLKSKISNQKSLAGFTLIEIIVAVFVFTLIVYGLIGLVSSILTNSKQSSTQLSDVDQSRKLVSQIVNELRNAQTSASGGYSLDTAADQQLIFYSNTDTDVPIERVRYYTQGGNLYKGITQYNGFTYNTSTESSVIVQQDVANASSTPLFYYYDGSYVGSSTQASLVQPVNVTAVKFVKINLQVYNKGGVKNTGVYTITASAAVRNLKTNLGQ